MKNIEYINHRVYFSVTLPFISGKCIVVINFIINILCSLYHVNNSESKEVITVTRDKFYLKISSKQKSANYSALSGVTPKPFNTEMTFLSGNPMMV